MPVLDDAADRAADAFERLATDHYGPSAPAFAQAVNRRVAQKLRRAALTAAAPSPDSTMVALYPRPEEAYALAQDGGEDPGTLHVTLCYLGPTGEDALPAILDAVRGCAGSFAPLEGTVGGVGVFQTNGDGEPVVALPDVPGLVELRVAVAEALLKAGVWYSRDHGFTAHITLGRGDLEPGDVLGRPLHFDDVVVARGDVPEALPLTGPPALTAGLAVRWDGRRRDARHGYLDMCRECGFKVSAPSFGCGQICPECGEVARATGDALTAASPPAWSAPAPDEVVDADRIVGQLRTKTDPVRLAVVETMMRASLDRAGIAFDPTNPFTAKVLAGAGAQIKDIADTTRLNVMRIVAASYDQGLSIRDTATAIREGMKAASPARATLIARTELAGAVNGGSLAAAQIVGQEAGIEYQKVWMTAPGARFPRHEDYEGLDGQSVAMDEAFDVGGFELQFPGDPDGPPEEVCNCRCTMSYEEAGTSSDEVDFGDGGGDGGTGGALGGELGDLEGLGGEAGADEAALEDGSIDVEPPGDVFQPESPLGDLAALSEPSEVLPAAPPAQEGGQFLAQGIPEGKNGGGAPAIAEAHRAISDVIEIPDDVKFVRLADDDTASGRLELDGSIGVHVDSGAETQTAVIAHEYGHYVDSRVLGTPDAWFTATASPEQDEIYQLLKNSPTMQAVRNNEWKLVDEDSYMERNYFLKGDEMFARAFEQWIAEKSGNDVLVGYLRRLQADDLLGFQVWQPDEFAPISDWFDRMFASKGMLRADDDFFSPGAVGLPGSEAEEAVFGAPAPAEITLRAALDTTTPDFYDSLDNMSSGVNQTYKGHVGGRPAIFKPVMTEEYELDEFGGPLRDKIVPGAGPERERAAYLMARELDQAGVPVPTPAVVVRRDLEGEPFYGETTSVQTYVPNTYEIGQSKDYIEQVLEQDQIDDAALFDAVIGNLDRHGGNALLDQDGGLHLIDHGLAFPYENTDLGFGNNIFQGIATDQRGGAVRLNGTQVEALEKIAVRRDDIDALLGPKGERLLGDDELAAMWERVDEMLETGELWTPWDEAEMAEMRRAMARAGEPVPGAPRMSDLDRSPSPLSGFTDYETGQGG